MINTKKFLTLRSLGKPIETAYQLSTVKHLPQETQVSLEKCQFPELNRVIENSKKTINRYSYVQKAAYGCHRLLDRYNFEQNDATLRQWAKTAVSSFLHEFHEFKEFIVICDETNNPPSVVDRDMFRVDVQVTFDEWSQIGKWRNEIYNSVAFVALN